MMIQCNAMRCNRGCINDVKNIKNFFQTHYKLDEIMVLTDDKTAEPETDCAPTRANVLKAFRWLVKGAKSGDSLLLHYSGHGGTVKNQDGTEGTESVLLLFCFALFLFLARLVSSSNTRWHLFVHQPPMNESRIVFVHPFIHILYCTTHLCITLLFISQRI